MDPRTLRIVFTYFLFCWRYDVGVTYYDEMDHDICIAELLAFFGGGNHDLMTG